MLTVERPQPDSARLNGNNRENDSDSNLGNLDSPSYIP